MAKKLSVFPRMHGTRPRYPWDEWLDGSVWELRQGSDFTINVANMRSIAYVAAKSKGLRCRVSVPAEGVLVIQAYPRDNGPQPS